MLLSSHRNPSWDQVPGENNSLLNYSWWLNCADRSTDPNNKIIADPNSGLQRVNYKGYNSFGVVHCNNIDVIMTTMASQITSFTVVYSTVYSDADKKKTSKLRVTGLCAGNSPGPVNSPHKGAVTRKMFPYDDVIMWQINAIAFHFEATVRWMISM